jgi:hypothetical protein
MVAVGTSRPPRAFVRAWAAGSGASLLLFTWLLTRNTRSLLTEQTQANFYDVQARSLLHGHWDVPLGVLNIEAFIVKGKAFMYFGPFPALIRIPIVAITDRFDGRLTQLSMIVAFVVALVAMGGLAWRARGLVLGERPIDRWETWATGVLALVLGGGSVVLFLANRPFVYDEAIIWGIAMSLAAYDQIIAFSIAPRRARLVRASLFATAAFLSRGSIGLGPVVALVVLALVAAVGGARRRDRRVFVRMTGLGLAALLPIVCYCSVNYVKFGTLTSIPVEKQYQVRVDPERRDVLRANDGKLFRFVFVPTTLVQYIRPDAIGFRRLAPWISFPSERAKVIGDVRFDTLDRASSAPASMPALTLLAVVGFVAMARRSRRRRRLAPFRAPVVGAALGGFLALTIAYVAHRYLGDLFPLLALGAIVGLPVAVGWAARQSRGARRAVAITLTVLAIASVAINLALAIWVQRAFSGNDRLVAPFVRFQHELDGRWLGGGSAGIKHAGFKLGRPAKEGEIRVVGDCDGTYWSDGQTWFGVERTNRTGRYVVRARFPDRRDGEREPLATSGPPDVRSIIAIRYLRDDDVRFEYAYKRADGVQWFRGPIVHLDRNRSHQLELLLDPRTKQARVDLDGRTVLEPLYAFARDNPRGLGRARPDDPVEPRFTGTLTNLPVGKPFCRGLQRRGQIAVYPAVRR